MKCERAQMLLSALIDGELEPVAAEAARRHLERCRPCQRCWQGLDRVIAWMERGAPSGLEPAAREVLLCRLHGELLALAPPAAKRQKGDRRGLAGSPWGLALAASLAAAALALAIWPNATSRQPRVDLAEVPDTTSSLGRANEAELASTLALRCGVAPQLAFDLSSPCSSPAECGLQGGSAGLLALAW